jgi:single-strand DNA-binding protein
MIIGNATKDPEMRYTPNGQAVTSFSVATNRRWTNKDSGEMQEQVEFHEVVVWGKMAENISQFVKKGSPVYVEGRLQTRSWEGQDGAKRQKTEIVAENVIALGNRGGGGGARPSSSESPVEEITKNEDDKTKDKEDEIDIDEIPF